MSRGLCSPGETPITNGLKIEGETIYYEGNVSFSAGACGFTGGQTCVNLPGTGCPVSNPAILKCLGGPNSGASCSANSGCPSGTCLTDCCDVTPVGGIPLICPGAAGCSPAGALSVVTRQIAYQVKLADADVSGLCPSGQVRGVFQYANGTSHGPGMDQFPLSNDRPVCNVVRTPTPTATPTGTPTETATLTPTPTETPTTTATSTATETATTTATPTATETATTTATPTATETATTTATPTATATPTTTATTTAVVTATVTLVPTPTATTTPNCGEVDTGPCIVTVNKPAGIFGDLQDAIDSANAGATIKVTGVCKGPIFIYKRADLTIEGVPPTVDGCPADGLVPTDLTSTVKGDPSVNPPKGSKGEVFKVLKSKNIVIRFLNVVDGDPHDGIEFRESDTSLAHCNCVTRNDEGINLHDGGGHGATQNLVYQNTGFAIRLIRVKNAMVLGNTSVDNDHDGILVDHSPGSTIADNVVERNEDDGIRVEDSRQTVMTGNVVRDNGDDGIELDNGDLGQVVGNTVTGNASSGIELRHADDNTINANIINGNGDGLVNLIRCFSGDGNTGSNVTPACQ